MFGLHVDYPPRFVSSKFDFASLLSVREKWVEQIVWPRPPHGDPITLTDYNSRAKQENNTKLATHSEMGVHYWQKVTPSSAFVQLLR